MKLAVFSDIQANYPALLTVTEHILAWAPDLVIMNGDLVNRGPCSLDCLTHFESLRETHGWIAIKGNHEEFVLHCSEANELPGSKIEREMQQFTDWTSQQLGDTAQLMTPWLDDYYFMPPNAPHAKVAAMHGSLLGNRVGILSQTTDEELATRVPKDISVFLTAHTHRPLTRHFKGCEIVNVGSGGSPFDGNPQASYAQLTFDNDHWKTEIIRLDYDRDAADEAYYTSGFLDHGGAMAKLIYAEWKQALSLIPVWRKTYMERLNKGEITLQESIDSFLSE